MPKATKRLGWFQVRVVGEERAKADSLLDRLVRRYPIATRAGLIRAALRLGFEALEKRPELALERGSTEDSRG